jgi:hypothetical protein
MMPAAMPAATRPPRPASAVAVLVVITAPNASVMAKRDAMNVFSIVVPHEWHSLEPLPREALCSSDERHAPPLRFT